VERVRQAGWTEPQIAEVYIAACLHSSTAWQTPLDLRSRLPEDGAVSSDLTDSSSAAL
jgi:hypothetical protein